jgi:hypothetical protein
MLAAHVPLPLLFAVAFLSPTPSFAQLNVITSVGFEAAYNAIASKPVIRVKNAGLNLLLRLRHGPPPCEPDDVSQAVLDLATRDWWYCAPDDEIERASNIHDATNPSVVKRKG